MGFNSGFKGLNIHPVAKNFKMRPILYFMWA